MTNLVNIYEKIKTTEEKSFQILNKLPEVSRSLDPIIIKWENLSQTK